MSAIDPRTVFFLGGIMSGVMALVLYALRRSYPASVRGIGDWSMALAIIFVATMLAATHGHAPQFISITVTRLLLTGGLYLAYVGTQRFYGDTPRPVPWMVLIIFVSAVQAWFTFVEPSYRARLVLANLLAGTLFAVHAHLVLKNGLSTLATRLTFAVLGGMAALQLMRLLTSFIWPVGDSIFETTPHHLLYVTSLVFCILLLSISLVLMAADRVRTELEHLATHDSLTNALTRRHMNEACEKELERCRRHGRSMALMVMDMDHFKAVNDTHGHLAGDQVLISFVRKVNGLLRRPDLLGRFGGEEFLLMLPDTSLNEAVLVAERIREACVMDTALHACTVSIGITTNRRDADSADAMLARADTAMYRAKANGRNRVETT